MAHWQAIFHTVAFPIPALKPPRNCLLKVLDKCIAML